MTKTEDKTKLTFALHYRKELNWSVFPLKPNSKEPYFSWKEFQERKASEDEIKDWWTKRPDSNIAIVTGEISSLAVLDCDGEEGIASTCFVDLPLTPAVKTPHGRHLYFSIPEGQTIKTHPQGAINLTGCELKAEGGYIVAPPSSIDGVHYAWIFKNPQIDGYSPAILPEGPFATLIDERCAILFKQEPDKGVSSYPSAIPLEERLKGVHEGQRNSSLASFAGSLFGRGFSYDDGLSVMLYTNQRNLPPLSEGEVVLIAKSIYQIHSKSFVRSTPKKECTIGQINKDEKKEEETLIYPMGGDKEGVSSDKSTPLHTHQTDTSTTNWFKTVAELNPGAPLSWTWHGFLSTGLITELVGGWKAGKTTLISHLLKVMDTGGELIGAAVKKTRALIISEEGQGAWKERAEALGLDKKTHLFYCLPFMGKPTNEEWIGLIERCVSISDRYDVVIVDTLANLWPVTNENDNALVGATIQHFRMISERGKALLLVHHPRKGSAERAQASRGAGALPAFVDILLEFKTYEAGGPDTSKRVIAGYSRRQETPKEVVIDLVDGQYTLLGDRRSAGRDGRHETILSVLPEDGRAMTSIEINDSWPDENKPAKSTLYNDLSELLKQGAISTTGEGARGDPVRYYRQSAELRSRS